MDRIETYVGQSILDWCFSKPDQNKMVALGKIISAMFGSSTFVNGLSCTPQSVAAMTVNIAPGEIYQPAQLEATACGSLPSDTAHVIMKQGIALDTLVVPNSATGVTAFSAPGIAGQSVNYLIEASYADADVSIDPTTGNSPVVLQFYNASNPTSPYQGPSGSGATSNTFRKGTVLLQVKAGTAATTGTQITPSPDTGYVGLWVVTVAYGQTSISAANISQYAAAPILPSSIFTSIQSGNLLYGSDISSSVNAVQASFPVPPTSLVDNQQFWVRIKNANTGAMTFTPNAGVIAAAPVVGAAHSALQGGECVANGRALFVWRADIASYVLESCSGGALQIANASASQQVPTAGQVISGSLGTATAGGSANAITASFPASPSAFATGQNFTIVSAATNTGAMTAVITLGGTAQASLPIVKGNNQALLAGDFPLGYPGEFSYSPAFAALVMQNPATGVVAQSAQLMPLSASVASSLITVNLGLTPLAFRSATLTSGGGTTINVPALSIAIPSIAASLGATTAMAAQLAVLVAYNGGSPVLCLANLTGGLDFSETGLISPSTISASATSSSTIYSASAVTAGSPYRVVGYLNATWTSGTGWSLSLVQPYGGQAAASWQSIGYGQTWQNMTASRTGGTTYYNTTSRPIFIAILGSTTYASQTNSLYINGVTAAYGYYSDSSSSTTGNTLTGIVPPGSYYSASFGGSLSTWSELR